MGTESGGSSVLIGFAGLADLVSDGAVERSQLKAAAKKVAAANQTSGTARPAATERTTGHLGTGTGRTHEAPMKSGSSAKWLWGLGVVIVILWIANSGDGNRGSERTANSVSTTPSASPPPAPQDLWLEANPPVGTNNVLTKNQIRYCLADDIRIDAAEPLVDNYSPSDVDRFNVWVSDYNSRCGSFQYRSGSLEAVQREVAKARSRLEAEGRARFAPIGAGVSSSPNNVPEPHDPQPDETVKDVQLQLLALGYDAGVADGLMGWKTLQAIQTFQRDQGLAEDGLATRALLGRLNRTQQRSVQGAQDFERPPVAAQSNAAPSPSPIDSPRIGEQTRNVENFQTCISGDYPTLCKHSLLTREEAVQVAAAERRANYQTCISGDYPTLCKHSLLTREEAAQVAAAERRANYQTCISGDYPTLCKHSLLTREEAAQVAAAERRANYQTCISGDYPTLCKHSLLTSEEAAQVAAAEQRARAR